MDFLWWVNERKKNVNSDELKDRTKSFAKRVLRVVDALPETITGRAIANQLVRSGAFVAENYRAACCARSKAKFAAKIGIVAEEADESVLWLELIVEDKILPKGNLSDLLAEAYEILSVMTTSRKTATSNLKSGK